MPHVRLYPSRRSSHAKFNRTNPPRTFVFKSNSACCFAACLHLRGSRDEIAKRRAITIDDAFTCRFAHTCRGASGRRVRSLSVPVEFADDALMKLLAHRISKLLIAFVAGLGASPCSQAFSQDSRPGGHDHPNIVLIVAASMGFGDVGFNGAKDISTPNLDRLARRSVSLSQAYSSAPICTPARAALLTGRYQHRSGLEHNLGRGQHDNDGLPPTEQSPAKLLARQGYSTALFGKWHLGFKPQFGPRRHGFDEFFGFHDWSIDKHSHHNTHGKPALYEGTQQVKHQGYLTDLITDRAVSYIGDHSDSPFFLYVAYSTALPPFQKPSQPKDVRTFENWYDGTRKDYAGTVERMDAGIGRILNSLERQSLVDNTLVIYTHDHGGESLSRNEPFFHGFGTLWEGGIHVPCLIRWPRKLPSGKVSNQASIIMDLTATILAAAGVQSPKAARLDGINLLPILSGDAPEVERQFFWRLDHSGRAQKAVRKGKWKYVLDEWNQLLFDLEADPSERRDLSYRHPSIRKELRGLLDQWEAEMEQANNR